MAEGAVEATPSLGRRPALDGVRALAVGLVVVGHIDDVLLPGGNDRVPAGFLGVDVFFVLSGFLVTTLLLEERRDTGRIDLRRFLGRRAGRLVPALALLLVAHALWAWIADLGIPVRDLLESVASVAFYVANYSETTGLSPAYGLGHLWSLSVEGQFYLVWAALVAAVLARSRGGLAAIGAAIGVGVAVAIAVRIVLFAGGGQWLLIYIRTDARMDALLLGAALALAFHTGLLQRVPAAALRIAAVAGLVVVVAAALRTDAYSAWLMDGGFTVVAVAAAALLAGVLRPGWWLSDLFALPPVRLVGRVSYGIYLWHLPVMLAVLDADPGVPQAVRVVLSLALTAAFVALSWRMVERPALEWSHRRFARGGTVVRRAPADEPGLTPSATG